MVRALSEILISLTLIFVFVNLGEYAKGAETSESQDKPSTSEPEDDKHQAEDLSNVLMLPRVVRRINEYKDGTELFADDDFYGRHFTATDGLYHRALMKLPSWMNEYVGEELKYAHHTASNIAQASVEK